MNDDELSRIRAQRLAELQSQSQSPGSSKPDQSEVDAQRHAQLSSFLQPDARDRLRRIALVKPARAKSIEDLLLRMARSGQIRQKVSETELVGLLEQVSEEAQEKKGIVKLRKEDSDDDWD